MLDLFITHHMIKYHRIPTNHHLLYRWYTYIFHVPAIEGMWMHLIFLSTTPVSFHYHHQNGSILIYPFFTYTGSLHLPTPTIEYPPITIYHFTHIIIFVIYPQWKVCACTSFIFVYHMYTKILTLLFFLPLTLSQSWSQSFKCESHCSERSQEEGQFRWYTEGSWSLHSWRVTRIGCQGSSQRWISYSKCQWRQ